MFKIPVAVWIVNAAARLTGSYGDLTRQADRADCSRQTVYDHARKVMAAVEAEHSGRPTHDDLIQQNDRLHRESDQLWEWLQHCVEFPRSRQQEFAVTAIAMGLSLNQVLVLLAIVLGTRAYPSRSTLQRWVKAAGQAAGRVLEALDARCRALVLAGCLDEIFFHRRPILVGVEPTSMAWSLGRKAPDRTGRTWCEALQEWTSLGYVVADAGTGLQAGIAALQQQRRASGRSPLENGLDVFHTAQEARRVLGQLGPRVEDLWDRAEVASRHVERAQQQGRDSRGLAVVARVAWAKLTSAFDRYEEAEAGWRLAHAALQVFRPDGCLNDRTWAAQQIALALPKLTGREWSKARGLLLAEGALTFLDRLHRQLHEAQPDEGLCGELVRLWWLRRHRPRGSNTGVVTGAGHVAHLVQQVVCHRRDATWPASYRAVSQVLGQAVRASSAVECMNSVLRMHQARHRTVTQGVLDLKRLYWNCRAFREGKRKGRCPYEHLGLKLPRCRFWDVLQMPLSESA